MGLKNKIMLLVLLLTISRSFAQNHEIGLQVGDSLPTFTIPKLINNQGVVVKTSDFRNQLLIIDFWNTGCSTCIESLPKMEALERQFGAVLKIVPVTDEKKDFISRFWKTNKYTKALKAYSVVEDKLFRNYFRNRFLPHEVWVYKGKIIGITSPDYVDDYNIKKVLVGQVPNWPLKNDFYTYNFNIPLFSIDSNSITPHSKSLKYSGITDFKSQVNSPLWLTGGQAIIRDTINRTIRAVFLNQPILNSYQIYWRKAKGGGDLTLPISHGFTRNSIIWDVMDPSKYFFEKLPGVYEHDWVEKNSICFESLIPDEGQDDKEIYRSIISDLDRLLGLRVYWTKLHDTVLVIKRIDSLHNSERLKGGKEYSVYEVGRLMNDESNNPYVFEERQSVNNNIYLNISRWDDITEIRRQLLVNGFELKEEQREVSKLVFSEVAGPRVLDREQQSAARLKRIKMDSVGVPSLFGNEMFFEHNRKKAGVVQTQSGLQYKIIKRGSGNNNIKDNSKVLIHYEGSLVNGKIFDSSYEKGIPMSFRLNRVIKGWAEGIKLMREGDIHEFYIPASLAYGSHTANGILPPDSILVFKIELIRILE